MTTLNPSPDVDHDYQGPRESIKDLQQALEVWLAFEVFTVAFREEDAIRPSGRRRKRLIFSEDFSKVLASMTPEVTA